MCLAQAEPSGVELARFYGRPRNSQGDGGVGDALSKREKHSLSRCSGRVVALLKPYHRKELE